VCAFGLFGYFQEHDGIAIQQEVLKDAQAVDPRAVSARLAASPSSAAVPPSSWRFLQ
jgi:hypothetical protein